ncbi:hypothetical protein PspLS_04031 [Pyricularia sp. CBS 133598]|nr:hypothetical protein PspLS_04031 [Pyricularia sp. CBS 133598]
MARPTVQDNEDEFGWDLSLEDELLLSNIADHAQDPARRPRSSSAGSETTITTITTVDQRVTAKRLLPARTSSTVPNLQADITAAFPASPWTEAIDIDSVADTASIGPRLSYDNAAHTSRFGGLNGQRHVSSGSTVSNVSEQSADFAYNRQTDVRYPDLSIPLSGINPAPNPDIEDLPQSSSSGNEAAKPLKSPLARFRTFPRKPLSVTDFSSLVWCEQQHEYTLTRLGGRKPRTAAMKGGTKIHEQLEREVYRTVRVEVMTKEDAFGLKIWNIIQGLRTLRDDGLTRELEVWGLVDGHVVNGLIDGLSVQHPDPQFEEELLSQSGSQEEAATLSENHKITDFFTGVNPSQDLRGPARKVWLFDVKTRGHWSLPSKVHLRPAMIQLYLYHCFLADMAAGRLDYLHVYRRYGLDPDLPFSDLFLAQIGSLHDEVFQDSTSTPQSPDSASQDSDYSSGTEDKTTATSAPSSMPADERLCYRSLRQLIPLLKNELKLTFPRGEASLGQVVSIEYRYRGLPKRKKEIDIDLSMEDEEDSDVGALIGHHNFNVADENLPSCLEDHMEWWRGERPANGVPVEEADKCRYCQFADVCEWRAENHLKLLEESRQRKARTVESAQKGKWRKYP